MQRARRASPQFIPRYCTAHQGSTRRASSSLYFYFFRSVLFSALAWSANRVGPSRPSSACLPKPGRGRRPLLFPAGIYSPASLSSRASPPTREQSIPEETHWTFLHSIPRWVNSENDLISWGCVSEMGGVGMRSYITMYRWMFVLLAAPSIFFAVSTPFLQFSKGTVPAVRKISTPTPTYLVPTLILGCFSNLQIPRPHLDTRLFLQPPDTSSSP